MGEYFRRVMDLGDWSDSAQLSDDDRSELRRLEQRREQDGYTGDERKFLDRLCEEAGIE